MSENEIADFVLFGALPPVEHVTDVDLDCMSYLLGQSITREQIAAVNEQERAALYFDDSE